MTSDAAIDVEILEQIGRRGVGRSICPSEVARAFGPGWRALMSSIRRRAIVLSEAGRVDILRKGRKVGAAEVRGVIRLSLPAPPIETDP